MKVGNLPVTGWNTFHLKLRDGGFRQGVLISFTAPNGRVAHGEASPLPGWSKESIEDVLQALEDGGDFTGLPSLLFAREMALAQISGWAGYAAPVPELPVCALIASGEPALWREATVCAVVDGAQTLKIKVRPHTATFLPDFLRWLDNEFPDEIKIRLDANRTWNFSDFLKVAKSLPEHRVEFFEEPIDEFQKLPELIKASPLPIALDETLREIQPEELDVFRGAAALIFKPTLMGGWETCRSYAACGAKLGMKAVISAAFESGVGISMLAGLALRETPGTAAGLDTYSLLEEDILSDALDFSGYRIRPFQLPPINEQRLD